MRDIDHLSYELGSIRLKLRRDLSFRRQSLGGEMCYVVEDPASSRFFRIGPTEYMFLSLLDGHTSIADAVAHCASQSGAGSFTETQAAALASWLIQNSLASTPQSDYLPRLIKNGESASAGKHREWMNPIMLKLPFGSPNGIVRRITPAAGWFFGIIGLVLWICVAILGGYSVFDNWDQITTTGPVLAADNWLWLGITWLLLKLAHEAAHAVACHRFGGDTREAGILLLLFVPLPYVDVSSAWRFGSKWQRIIVSAAGMYIELFIAALAAIAWTHSDSHLIQHHAVNVMLTAGCITLLFNLNPLMRFDGYYILSDLFDLPNLATHGQQDLRSLAKRWLFGVRTSRATWPDGSAVIRFYGIAAFIWRILICISLTLAAEMLYHGAGIVLAVAAVHLWLVLPAIAFIRYLVVGDRTNPPNRLRFAGICGTLTLVGCAVWNYVPYVERLQLPAIVECDPVFTVRAGTSGFVRSVEVESGQSVEVGQVLARLEDPKLASRMADTRLALQQSQLDATRFHRQGKLAAFQIELENEASLNKRLDELIAQSNQLVIRAPSTGTIFSRNLDDLQDRWLKAGSQLCMLGDESERAVHVLIPQSDIDLVRRSFNKSINVHVWGQPREFTGSLTSIESRGTTTLRFPALAANAGGPLEVRSTQQNNSSETEWHLLEPHFTARIHAPKSDIRPLGTGQTAIVEIASSRGTIGEMLVAKFIEWNERRRLKY